jgi:hypothetical protein
MKQTRQPVRTIQQSIYLDVYARRMWESTFDIYGYESDDDDFIKSAITTISLL